MSRVSSHHDRVERFFHVQIGRVQMFGFELRFENGTPFGEDNRLGRGVPKVQTRQILGKWINNSFTNGYICILNASAGARRETGTGCPHFMGRTIVYGYPAVSFTFYIF